MFYIGFPHVHIVFFIFILFNMLYLFGFIYSQVDDFFHKIFKTRYLMFGFMILANILMFGFY